MRKSIVKKVVKICGSQAELARRMGVTPPYVIKMLNTGRVPAERCLQIEVITGGAVRMEELRPDIFTTKGRNKGALMMLKEDIERQLMDED